MGALAMKGEVVWGNHFSSKLGKGESVAEGISSGPLEF
jgi:hypothetical protein